MKLDNVKALALADAAKFFGVKEANVRLVMPSVAGGVLGRYLGQAAGSKLNMPFLGDVVGPIIGTSVGASFGDDLEKRRQQHNGHPASLNPQMLMDQTSQNIPPWALSLANVYRDQGAAKAASDAGLRNILMENLVGPFAAIHTGYKQDGIPGALRVGGGTMAGGMLGGLAGAGAGKLLTKAVGHDPSVMGISGSHLLAGLGSILGGTRAFEHLIR